MVSALNTSRRTSGSCPTFILASDCAKPPVPTSWFLPHAGLHLGRLSIPGRRSSSVERATGQCHLRTIFVLIPATPGRFNVAAHVGDDERQLRHLSLSEQNYIQTKKNAQRDAITARALAVVRFGHRPPACYHKPTDRTDCNTLRHS